MAFRLRTPIAASRQRAWRFHNHFYEIGAIAGDRRVKVTFTECLEIVLSHLAASDFVRHESPWVKVVWGPTQPLRKLRSPPRNRCWDAVYQPTAALSPKGM